MTLAVRDSVASAGHRKRSATRERITASLPCIVAALPFAVLAGRVLWRRRNPLYSGDAALLELAVRSAAHGNRTLGPYSRFGFFHPGPAMFYVLSPFEWITRGAAWALPFGVEVLNAVVAVALVLVVQRCVTRRAISGRVPHLKRDAGVVAARTRRDGLVAATAAAVAILLYALAVDIGLLQILWNPLQIMLPTALVLVSVAFIDGWGWPAAVALAAGTFAIQTDLSTVPVTMAASGCGAAWLALDVIRAKRCGGSSRPEAASTVKLDVRRHHWQLGPIVLTTLAALAWIPPVLQQLTGHPGNVTRLIRFFLSPDNSPPGWGRAAAYAGRELAVFPLRIPWEGTLTASAVHGRWGEVELVAFVVAAAALVLVGRIRRSRPVTRLGVISIVVAVAAVYSIESIRGPVYWYLTAWMSALAVPLLLGWLLVAVEVVRPLGGAAVKASLVIVAVAAAVVASSTAVDDNRAFPNEPLYRADTAAAWRLVAPAAAEDRGRPLLLGGDPALLPTIAGVALEMTRSGVDVRVTDPLVPPFGPEERGAARLRPELLITVRKPPPGYRILGRAPSKLLGAPTVIVSLNRGSRQR